MQQGIYFIDFNFIFAREALLICGHFGNSSTYITPDCIKLLDINLMKKSQRSGRQTNHCALVGKNRRIYQGGGWWRGGFNLSEFSIGAE